MFFDDFSAGIAFVLIVNSGIYHYQTLLKIQNGIFGYFEQ